MRGWRVLWLALSAVLLLIVAALLYLGFADLGRHKSRIENLLAGQLGRPFAIEGPLRLRLFPEFQLHAERVRLANAEWGSAPDMARIGSITARLSLWSLVSGPPELRQLDIEDAEVNLEEQADGRANWKFRAAKTPPADEKDGKGLTEFPLVIHSAGIRDVHVRLHRPGQPALEIDAGALTVATREGGMLEVQGRGSVDERKVALDGQLGPVQSLISGRDIRLDLSGSLDRFQLKAAGALGRLNPLRGADLKLDLEDADVGLLFQRLRLPPMAKGPLKVSATLKSEAKGTGLNVDARAGDLQARISGTLQAFALKGADLSLRLEKPQGEQLLQALKLPVVATGNLRLDAQVRDAGRNRQLSLQGALGKLEFGGKGTFTALRLKDADLQVHAEKAEGREVLEALKLPVVATGALRVDARIRDAGRSRQLSLEGGLGDLSFKGQGSIKSPRLKDGDFELHVEKSEARELLEALKLPVIATGALRADASLKTEDKQRRVNLDVLLGDIGAKIQGTLPALALNGSDLQVQARVGDAHRLGVVFGVGWLPSAPVELSGRLQPSTGQLKLEAVHFAGENLSADVSGTLSRGEADASLRIVARAEDLSKLAPRAPPQPLSVSATLQSGGRQLRIQDLDLQSGDSRLTGKVLWNRGVTPAYLDADLASSHLDLSPWLPKEAAPKKTAAKEKGKFLFNEKPLSVGKQRTIDAQLHLRADQVLLHSQQLTRVDASLVLDAAGNFIELSATGPRQGSVNGKLRIAPSKGGGAPRLTLALQARGVRSDVGGDEIPWSERPPLDIDVELESRGESPRELAAAANGRLLVVEGPGKVKAGLIRLMGGDVLAQLAVKLNPFRESDPYTKLDCLVARAGIVNGKVTVDPVLMQSTKVMVTADGRIDLSTERIEFDFATRPRQGIGISPGMFTNPFLKLEGTLRSPRIGVGAKGVASGAVAAATAGVSVLAEGVVDRIRGEVDACKKTLQAAEEVQ